MERCVHANGWRAMETDDEQGLFYLRRYKEGAVSVANH